MLETMTAHLRENQFWPWLFRATQVASLVIFLYWYWHLPPPGYAIGVLAVLAALMSLHIEAKMKWWDKAAWMLLMGVFLFLELSAIDKDRKDQESAHRAELARQDEASQNIIKNIISSANFQIDANKQRFDQALKETRRAVEPFTASDLDSAQMFLTVLPQPLIKPYTDRVNPVSYPRINEIRFEVIPSGTTAKPSPDSDANLVPQPGKESERSLAPLLSVRGYSITLKKAGVEENAHPWASSTATLTAHCPTVKWRIVNDFEGRYNSIHIECTSEKVSWNDSLNNFTSYMDFNGANARVKLTLANSDDLEIKLGSLALTIKTDKGRVLSSMNLTHCPQEDEPSYYCGWFTVTTRQGTK